MGAAFFYHLTQRPLEATLPMLLTKALQAGWRVAVRGRDAGQMAWLDEKLWLGPEDGFLPHGLAGGAHEADQPVLLTTQEARVTRAYIRQGLRLERRIVDGDWSILCLRAPAW